MLKMMKMMTVKELAKYINVKEKTIYNFAEKGLIPHYRLNRLIRFRKNEIDQWIDSKRVKSSKEPVSKIIRSVYDDLVGRPDRLRKGGRNAL